MSTTPNADQDPAATPPDPTHRVTGGTPALERDAELTRREDEAETPAEAIGLEQERVQEEQDRQAEAAVDALNRGAPD